MSDTEWLGKFKRQKIRPAPKPPAEPEPKAAKSTTSPTMPKIGTPVLLFCAVSVVVGLYFYNDTQNRAEQKRALVQQKAKDAIAARAPKLVTAAERIERDNRNREYIMQLEKEAYQKAVIQDILKLDDIAVRFNDLNQVASVSPRITLAGPVQQMQMIRREIEATQTHQCLAPAKTALAAMVASTTSAYLSFMESGASDNNAYTKSHVENMKAHAIDYQKKRDGCLT